VTIESACDWLIVHPGGERSDPRCMYRQERIACMCDVMMTSPLSEWPVHSFFSAFMIMSSSRLRGYYSGMFK